MNFGAAPARTFASLRRHYNYRLYFAGQVISVSGTWMQNVAQAWLILELTHSSAIAVGVLALCQFGPYALGGLFGGVVADRLNLRRGLVATQSSMALAASVLAILAFTDRATSWEVYLLASVNGIAQIFDTPMRQAFTIQMVGRRELPNAIALNSTLFNGSRVIGPAIGGVLIASAGVGVCFAINALSFLAVIAGLLLMRSGQLFPIERGQRGSNIWRELGDGVGYSWRTPTARLVIMMMLVIGLISINFSVILPVLAATTLHQSAAVFGALSACFGGGALMGALFSASLGSATTRVMLTGALLMGGAETGLAFMTTVTGVAILLGAVGFAFSLYGSQSNANLQLMVPDYLRGRVMAIYAYVFFGTAPLGGLFTGWLSQRGGTGAYFLVAGIVAMITALAGVLSRELPSLGGRYPAKV